MAAACTFFLKVAKSGFLRYFTFMDEFGDFVFDLAGEGPRSFFHKLLILLKNHIL